MKKVRILDGTALKLFAMIAMIIDHLKDSFFPEQIWMKVVGRLAMPVFAFMVAEGYHHTRDREKYLLRLFVFGLISEIPFDLVVKDRILELTHQNIMFTFAWSVLCLMCIDRIAENENRTLRYVLNTVTVLFFAIGSLLMGLDYNIVGPAVIVTYHFLREKSLVISNSIAALIYLVFRNVGVYAFGVMGFIPIYLYNGKRGKGLKWLFYCFYPLHLLLIYLIRSAIH